MVAQRIVMDDIDVFQIRLLPNKLILDKSLGQSRENLYISIYIFNCLYQLFNS